MDIEDEKIEIGSHSAEKGCWNDTSNRIEPHNQFIAFVNAMQSSDHQGHMSPDEIRPPEEPIGTDARGTIADAWPVPSGSHPHAYALEMYGRC